MAKEKRKEKRITLSVEQVLSLYQNQRTLMDSILQQEQLLQNALQETLGAQAALKEISAADKNIKALVSIGSGVFVEAELTGKKVKSEIGGGVVQAIPVKKALERLEEGRKNILSNLSKLRKRKEENAKGLARLETIMQELQKAVREKQKTTPGVS